MVDVSVTVSGSFKHLQINTCVWLQSVSFGVSRAQAPAVAAAWKKDGFDFLCFAAKT
jgi:hypothetical protein